MDAARKRKPDPRLSKSVSELAASPALSRLLKFVASRKQWIAEMQLEFCRIPAPTFFEDTRAQWFAAQFKALGWDARIDRAGNVVALLDPKHPGPFLALTAHLDTVLSPKRKEDVYIGGDGRFHGPGVADNGAGLAALLALAAAWKIEPPPAPNIALIANVGEEGEGNLSGMRFLCKQSPLAGNIFTYLVLDGPGTDYVTCRALASRRFEVSIHGPGGHSWSDHGNANPVHALARAIHYFTEGQYPEALSAPRISYNFGLIEGGVSINSIPSLARTKLDVRSEDPARLEELALSLNFSLERAVEIENDRSSGGRVQARIKEIGSRPGGALPDNSHLLPSLHAVDHYLSIRPILDCASTDANIPLSMGLEAVSIGTGGQGGGAHTPEEWYDPEGRELGLHRILLLSSLLLSSR